MRSTFEVAKEREKLIREKWRMLKPTLDERGRRLWAGSEAHAYDWGGVAAVARATRLAISTVRKGWTRRDRAYSGCIVIGTPASTALPDSGSRSVSSSSALRLAPGRSRARPSRVPG